MEKALNITDQCRQAVLEHGILMNGDEPAGNKLMELPTMRIAIIQNEFPPELMTDAFKKHTENFDFDSPDAFPDGTEAAVRRALGYWYTGKVEFVKNDQNPDMRIAAYKGSGTIGGFASFPPNDRERENLEGQFESFEYPVMGIEMRSMRFAAKYSITGTSLLEGIEDTIRHEFGHSFGILHTTDILYDIKQSEQRTCNEKDIKTLSEEFSKSVMQPVSAEPAIGSQTDVLIKETIEHGLPKP